MVINKQQMMDEMMAAFYSYSAVNEFHIKQVDSSLSVMEIMMVLHLTLMEQPQRPKELADYFCISSSNLSNLLKRVESKGLILRRVHPYHVKEREVLLTETGKVIGRVAYQKVESLTQPLLKSFSVSQRQYMLQLVKTYMYYIRGGHREYALPSWSMMDYFVYYYYQLFYGVEWAIRRKNPFPVSFKEARLLNLIPQLKQNQDNTVTMLAHHLHISRSECSDLVQRLIQHGVIERVAHPTDQRISFLEYTTDAQQRIQQFVKVQSGWFDQRILQPKLKDLIAFFLVMRKFTAYYRDFEYPEEIR